MLTKKIDEAPGFSPPGARGRGDEGGVGQPWPLPISRLGRGAKSSRSIPFSAPSELRQSSITASAIRENWSLEAHLSICQLLPFLQSWLPCHKNQVRSPKRFAVTYENRPPLTGRATADARRTSVLVYQTQRP